MLSCGCKKKIYVHELFEVRVNVNRTVRLTIKKNYPEETNKKFSHSDSLKSFFDVYKSMTHFKEKKI
jgi:hypothetical protein